MDPDTCLKKLRDAITLLDHDPADPVKVDAVVELFEALDCWISRGGFLPSAWRR